MITRKQKIKVGIFLTACFTIFFVLMVMLSGFETEPSDVYYLEFDISVSGLGAGADVRYLGVPVGKVIDMAINKKNKILVTIKVFNNRVTLYKGVTAVLKMKGITGLSYVSLSGGELNDELIQSGSFIETKPSIFTAVMDQVPFLLDEVKELLKKIDSALSLVDRNDITNLLSEVTNLLTEGKSLLSTVNSDLSVTLNSFSETSNALKENITKITKRTDLALDTLDSSVKVNSKALKSMLDTTQTLIVGITYKVDQMDVEDLNYSMKEALVKIGSASKSIERLMYKVRDEAPNMSKGMMRVEYDIHTAVKNLNKTLMSIKVLIDAIEENPRRVLIGN